MKFYINLNIYIELVISEHHQDQAFTFKLIASMLYFLNLRRWDEWVPRSRLRWAVDKNEVVSIQSNDIVELWCCGANVRNFSENIIFSVHYLETSYRREN